MKEFKIAETDANGFPSLIYVAYSFPMLLTDRDSVNRLNFTKIDDKTSLLLCPAIEHPSFPEKEGKVRLKGFSSIIFEQVGPDVKQTKYT